MARGQWVRCSEKGATGVRCKRAADYCMQWSNPLPIGSTTVTSGHVHVCQMHAAQYRAAGAPQKWVAQCDQRAARCLRVLIGVVTVTVSEAGDS